MCGQSGERDRRNIEVISGEVERVRRAETMMGSVSTWVSVTDRCESREESSKHRLEIEGSLVKPKRSSDKSRRWSFIHTGEFWPEFDDSRSTATFASDFALFPIPCFFDRCAISSMPNSSQSFGSPKNAHCTATSERFQEEQEG